MIVSDSDKVSDSEEDSTIENQESYFKRNYLDISNAAVASDLVYHRLLLLLSLMVY